MKNICLNRRKHHLLNDTGFTISSLLYPVFILIITVVIVIIIVVTQTSFSSSKLTGEISGDLSNNNTMKSLKENVESAIEESSTTGLVYNASGGIIFNTPFTTNINTKDWNGKVYTSDEGDKLAYVDNGTYCAFQLPGMSGVAVYNTGICVEKIKAYAGITDLVCNNGSSLSIAKIANASSLPATSTNYNVAVVTTIDIDGYLVSDTTPTSPKEGMVWFVNSTGTDKITYLKSFSNSIGISGVKQYQSGAWVDVYAFEYYDAKWNILFKTVFDYTYTGSIQTFIVPMSGTYLLEVWGAQGGNSLTSAVHGGYGGYSTGKITLTAGNTLYLGIGGQGLSNSNGTFAGGYNGGSDASCGSAKSVGTGGGATHIATATGLLSSLSGNKGSVIIVAGGGGGANYESGTYNGNGGSGGGIVGMTGSSYNGTSSIVGTQTTGYAFGTAGSQTTGERTGSGGGYYGGNSATAAYGISGAGGSGYINTSLLTSASMYCYSCTTSSATATLTYSTTNVSDTATTMYSKKGNGYIRITYISE